MSASSIPNPDELIALARAVLSQGAPVAPGLRSRAAALLGRQALEAAVDTFWAVKEPRVADSRSMRAQLLCLRSYADDETAERARLLWWALSRACHHHPYELAPAPTELRALLDDVSRLTRSLLAPTTTAV